MSRKITRSFASFLRAWGNDHPDRGFAFGELVQPVITVADESHAAERMMQPIIYTRLQLGAAGAGIYSLAGYTAPGGGALLQLAEMGNNTRLGIWDDGTDGITTPGAAVDPSGNFRTRMPFAGRLRYGTAAADPNPGTETIMLTTGELIENLYLPSGCAIAFWGSAANQIVSLARIHIVEGVLA